MEPRPIQAWRNRLALAVAWLLGAAGSQAAITGQWDFNSGNLSATIGSELVYRGDTASFTTFETATIGGATANVMHFPKTTPAQGYEMTHGAAPNGGGSYVNQYSLIMDLMFPASSSGKWRALLQTSTANANDGELFVNTGNGIGISGSYHGAIVADTWHRVAFVLDLTLPSARLRKSIDGTLVGTQDISGVDDRWALDPLALLFADEDNETQSGFVNCIQFHDLALPDSYLAALGGPSAGGIPTELPVPPAVAGHSFAVDASNNLLLTVNFSEAVDAAAATNPANYVFASGATVSNGELAANGQDVTFIVNGTLGCDEYMLTVSGVRDLDGNTMTATSLTGKVRFPYPFTGLETATQSSSPFGLPAEKAIDGNPATWMHTSNGDNEWWELDLGSPVSVGGIAIWFRQDCCFERDGNLRFTIMDAARTPLWTGSIGPALPGNLNPRMANLLVAPVVVGQIVRIEHPQGVFEFLNFAEVQVLKPSFDLCLVSDPVNQTARRNGPATFTVGVQSSWPITYQWRHNGANITGATGAALFIASVGEADLGPYDVVVSDGRQTLTSAPAELAFFGDTEPPTVAGHSFTVDTFGNVVKLSVTFSEEVTAATATAPANYVFAGGATVSNGELAANGIDVTFVVEGLLGCDDYTLTVSGVQDLAGNPLAATQLTGTLPAIRLSAPVSGTASQSSNPFGLPASNALDGNLKTIAHTFNGENEWWEWDLEMPVSIGAIAIWFREDCCAERDSNLRFTIMDGARTPLWTGFMGPALPGNLRPRMATLAVAPVVMGQIVRIEHPPGVFEFLDFTEVRVLGPSTGLCLVSDPVSQTVRPNAAVSFTVGAQGPDPISYQWRHDGVDIPGATSATLTIPSAGQADLGFYSAVVSDGRRTLTSAPAELSFFGDTEPPTVVGHSFTVDTFKNLLKLTVNFSEEVTAATATAPANYAIAGGATVSNGELAANGKDVTFLVEGLLGCDDYSLAVSGVQDLAGNTLAATTLTGTLPPIRLSFTGGAATQSSNPFGLPAGGARDGNLNSLSHTSNGDNEWWELDLESPVAIGALALWLREDTDPNRDRELLITIMDGAREPLWSAHIEAALPGSLRPRMANFVLVPVIMGQVVRIEHPVGVSEFLQFREVQVLGPSTGLCIVTGPVSQSVAPGAAVTFGVDVQGNEPFTYQWLHDGVNIPGATSARLEIPSAGQSDAGLYTVVVTDASRQRTSAPALLSLALPTLSIAAAGNQVTVAWSGAGWVLQENTNLGNPAGWTDVPGATASPATLTIGPGNKFFRLKKL